MRDIIPGIKISALWVLLLIAGGCEVTMKIKSGSQAFEYKQYSVAVEMLEEEYEKEDNLREKAQLASLLARSHDILQNFGEALKWYDITDQLSQSIQSREDLAGILKKNEQYGEAMKIYSELYEKTRENRYLRELEISRKALYDLENPPNHVIQPLRENTVYRDYAPVIFENNFLVFSSDREESTGNDIDKWTGYQFSDLFISNLQTHKVSNFDALLNTGMHEGAATFSKDFNEIYFTRTAVLDNGKPFNRIYYSQRHNGSWLEPEPLLFFGEGYNFGQPALIENDSVLIFSVSKAGTGQNHDLYYSERLENGWSEAQIMPPPINTEGNEQFPTAYNDTLFFSSDFHPGYGGYDIFKTFLRPNGSWAPVENMGIPVNSGADDFALEVDVRTTAEPGIKLQGYLSSSRNTGFNDDIFFFTIYKEEKEPEGEEEVITDEEESYDIFLAGRVVELKYEDDDPNKRIIQRTPMVKAYVKLTGPDSTRSFFTDSQGLFVKELKPGQIYDVLASKQDYLSQSKKVNTQFQLKNDTTINIELALDRIIFDTEIILQNIYYDFDKWDIREDARPALDSLAGILEVNPGISIRLSSHTDCRGEEDYNRELSQRRAQSAVDYLTNKGIDSERLVATGYGESRPAVDCACASCTEDQHQTNRRTAFTILKDR